MLNTSFGIFKIQDKIDDSSLERSVGIEYMILLRGFHSILVFQFVLQVEHTVISCGLWPGKYKVTTWAC